MPNGERTPAGRLYESGLHLRQMLLIIVMFPFATVIVVVVIIMTGLRTGRLAG
jgi:hypothetical protein